MLKKTKSRAGCAAVVAFGLLGPAAIAADTGRNISLDDGHGRLRLANAVTVGTYQRAGRVNSIYGPAFSTGATPTASADAFLAGHAGLLRTGVEDLVPIGPFPNGQHLVRTGYDRETDRFKHVIVGYTQFRDDVPVFRGSVKLIVLNQANYPLILVNNAVRDLGDFRPDVANLPVAAANLRAAKQAMPALERFDEGRLVIWAGVDDVDAAPVLAREFLGESGQEGDLDYEKWLLIVDARTGELIYSEDRVLHVDVVGNTSGNATDGIVSDVCGPEIPYVLPHMEVNISGGGSAISDANGDFVIAHSGSSDVTVNSPMDGLYFFVNAEQGAEDDLSMVVTPPGPADFVHNADNTQEFVRSQTNAYLHANLTRDTALFHNPDFPVIGSDRNFQINVNRAATCNATYSGSSINFYASGDGCPNSAISTIVQHEYGHHLVETSNGGAQGQYGEGYGDVQGVLLMDDPGTGYGFFGPCDSPARTAEAGINYPCTGAIHTCGQLISGCVWDTRNALIVTEPADYLEILRDMSYNAMPMHAPSSTIAPDITIDYITADDDDGNILNGSPHYTEIATGFGMHNMDAPPLVNVQFQYPNGRPTVVVPDTPTTFDVNVLAITDDPVAGTGMIHVEIDEGGVVSTSMDQISDNMYEATLPAVACGSEIRWWVSTETVASGEVTDPTNAPFARYLATTASFADDGETDPGWSVSGDAIDGQWDRGIPVNCNRGDPNADADGSGQCWLTDNSAGSGCNSDVDGGHTILTSPTLDASGDAVTISYRRWYSNTAGSDPNNDIMTVEVSDDDGGSWTLIDTVGPGGPEADGGWFDVEHDLTLVEGLELNEQFRIRFDVSDLKAGSVVEAGIDAVELVVCSEGAPCPQDLDGSGAVDFQDVLQVLENWGGPGPEGDADGNGTVDFQDIVSIISNWGPCK